MKQLALGEYVKTNIVGDAQNLGDCILCDLPVWASKTAYTIDEPTKEHEIPKEAKPLHKKCIVELFALGGELVGAIEKQMEYRKKN